MKIVQSINLLLFFLFFWSKFKISRSSKNETDVIIHSFIHRIHAFGLTSLQLVLVSVWMWNRMRFASCNRGEDFDWIGNINMHFVTQTWNIQRTCCKEIWYDCPIFVTKWRFMNVLNGFETTWGWINNSVFSF